MAILAGVRWYHIVVWFAFSWLLVMWSIFLYVCWPFVYLENCLFMSLAHFLMGLFVFVLLICILCRFWILVLCWMHSLRIFSPTLCIVRLLCWSFLLLCKFFSLIKSHIFIFVFIAFAFGFSIMKSLPKPISRRVFPMLSSGIFWFHILDLSIWSILSWFLYKVRDENPVSFFYKWLANDPSTICWRGCHFLTLCFCFLCWRSVGCKYLALFLGSLFCSISLYLCFGTSTMLFWLL